MYSITSFVCKYCMGVFAALLLVSFSVLLPEGVEGRNKATGYDFVTEYDQATGNDPAIEGDKNHHRKMKQTRNIDPAIKFEKTRKSRQKVRTKRREGDVATRRGKKATGPVATLVFAGTLKGESSSDDLLPQSGQRNFFGDEEFSIAAIRDIFIQTHWTQIQGEHIQRIHIYSPDGNIFQKRVVPFSITEKLKRQRRKVSGITNMVDVQKAKQTKDGQAVVVHFPVSGTWVSQHSMLGTWRVDAFLNQESRPSVSGTFTLIE